MDPSYSLPDNVALVTLEVYMIPFLSCKNCYCMCSFWWVLINQLFNTFGATINSICFLMNLGRHLKMEVFSLGWPTYTRLFFLSILVMMLPWFGIAHSFILCDSNHFSRTAVVAQYEYIIKHVSIFNRRTFFLMFLQLATLFWAK